MKSDRCLALRTLWFVALLAVASAMAADVAAEKTFVPPPIELPPGFQLELAAAPPLVGYPLMACLDDRGRLYVAESDGRNLTKKEDYLRELPRFIRRLEDVDGDGKYDKSTIFADKMTMPEGGLWHNGALYIISAPYLWRLEDLDGDGVADRREKILGYMEFDGRANQHGPYLGPDGRLYFSGGHFGYDLVGTDGSRTGSSRAAGVFSCWPDGRDVQIEGLGGINPVDIVFTETGEMLSTCAIFDSFAGRHDALIHWIRGGLTQKVYGVPLLPESGYRLPAMSQWGQVAPAGFVRYRGGHFGKEYRDTYFACQFNTHKLVQVRLKPSGATFVTEEKDFLTSPNHDFHPADVLEDADGSLLLLDTGGWLTWGCPYSKIAKPEIKGAIYRVRRTGGISPTDPRGLKLDWNEAEPADLIARLNDARPTVRDRSIETLVGRSDAAVAVLVETLGNSANADERRNVVWILSRIPSDAGRAAIRRALGDPDEGVRMAAIRSLGTLKDRAAVLALAQLLPNGTAPVRRAAATALGQIGDRSAVPWIFQALEHEAELYLLHALTYALIEIADPVGTSAYLTDSSRPGWQRTALRVLEQMKQEGLMPSMVMPLLSSKDPGVRNEARRVIAARTDWKPEITQVFISWLDAPQPDPAAADHLEGIVLALAGDAPFIERVGGVLGSDTISAATKLQLLAAIGLLDKLPAALNGGLQRCLGSSSAELRNQAVAAILPFEASPFIGALRHLAERVDEPDENRVGALEAMVKIDGTIEDGAFEYLAGLIRRESTSPLLRRQTARAVGHLRPSAARLDQMQALCALVEKAGPMEIAQLLRPFEHFRPTAEATGQKAGNSPPREAWPEETLDGIGHRLVRSLRTSPGLSTLRPEQLTALLQIFPESVRRDGDGLRSKSRESGESSEARHSNLSRRLAEIEAGNASTGRSVFFSNRAACFLCHRVQGEGGTLGPDLSKIGAIRGRRDLLEAILYPSSTLVNGYESYAIDMTDGEIHSGLIHRENREAIYLRNADQREIRIRRDQIRGIRMSPVSTMPEGLGESLGKRELADLVEFLVQCQ